MMLRDAGWVTLGSIGAAAAYLRLIRPWQLRWGRDRRGGGALDAGR